jgi:DNA-binding NarL/FixJ family response regulator
MTARILLVEDDFLVAMTMENDLAEGNYEIAGVANSADAAVSLAKKARPDLVVMDIRLVGPRDGVDAALEIFAATGIRCLFATANADAQARTRAAPAQPLGWLQKPYGREALLSALAEAVQAAQSSLQPPPSAL